MKRYTMSWAAAQEHKPEHPERTARRSGTGMDFDVTFQVWPNRPSMAKTIRLQEQREHRHTDWSPCVKLSPSEGC